MHPDTTSRENKHPLQPGLALRVVIQKDRAVGATETARPPSRVELVQTRGQLRTLPTPYLAEIVRPPAEPAE